VIHRLTVPVGRQRVQVRDVKRDVYNVESLFTNRQSVLVRWIAVQRMLLIYVIFATVMIVFDWLTVLRCTQVRVPDLRV
jgi:hypothetical protein